MPTDPMTGENDMEEEVLEVNNEDIEGKQMVTEAESGATTTNDNNAGN
jgi:hypothetical protein